MCESLRTNRRTYRPCSCLATRHTSSHPQSSPIPRSPPNCAKPGESASLWAHYRRDGVPGTRYLRRETFARSRHRGMMTTAPLDYSATYRVNTATISSHPASSHSPAVRRPTDSICHACGASVSTVQHEPAKEASQPAVSPTVPGSHSLLWGSQHSSPRFRDDTSAQTRY